MSKPTAYQNNAEQLPSQVLEVGTLVRHVNYRDFQARVVRVDNGRCLVEVLSGWRGRPPTWPVGEPVAKLEAVE